MELGPIFGSKTTVPHRVRHSKPTIGREQRTPRGQGEWHRIMSSKLCLGGKGLGKTGREWIKLKQFAEKLTLHC